MHIFALEMAIQSQSESVRIQFPGNQLEATGEFNWFPGSSDSIDWTVDLHESMRLTKSLKPTTKPAIFRCKTRCDFLKDCRVARA